MNGTFRQIVDLLSDEERWKVVGILVAAAGTGIIETFSVASIMPFMAVVASPGLIQENSMLAWLGAVSGTETYSGFLLVLALLVLVILLLSHAFIALTTWLVAKFVWQKHHILSRRLLTRYLAQPYPFFLGRNTSELSEHLLREIETVIRGVLNPAMDVLVKGIISVLLVGFLAYVDPLLAVVVAVVLGGAYVGIWSVVREKQGEIGTQQLDANRKRFRVATEAFQGIKELKALGRESLILERYSDESRRFARHSTQHELAARIPRNVMEVIAFGGVLLVVVYLLTARGGLGEALPVLAAFTFAGYKLMPALQGVFAGLVQVRFHAPALDAVHRDLFGEPGVILAEAEEAEAEGERRGRRAGDPRRGRAEPTPHTSDSRPGSPPTSESGPAPSRRASAEPLQEIAQREPLPFDEGIVLDEVAYRYDRKERPVLQGVSLRIRKGEMVGLVGATGSGKTTLVDLILGLLSPWQGRILVDGQPLTGERRLRWRRSVGYVPQEIFLGDESVAANIAFGIPPDDVDGEQVVRAAAVARIHDFIESLPEGYDTVVGERGVRLSGGQRQRIGIARALYGDPPVLVMDEGTSDLDSVTEAAVTRAIREADPRRTVIWIAHRLRTVERCDRIYLLEEGRVADSGPYEDLLRTSEQFRAMAQAGTER